MRDDRNTGRGVDNRAGVRGLERLGDLSDFKVADGEPDIRGWDVLSSDRRKIGKVHDLLVDTGAMKVRYLDLELDRKELHLRDDRHVLVPIGVARLDDQNDDVQLPTLGAAELAGLPMYDHEAITRDREREILSGFPGSGSADTLSAAQTSDDFYAHDHFSDRDFWGRRRTGRDQSTYFARSDVGDVAVNRPIESDLAREQTARGRETNRPIDRGGDARR